MLPLCYTQSRLLTLGRGCNLREHDIYNTYLWCIPSIKDNWNDNKIYFIPSNRYRDWCKSQREKQSVEIQLCKAGRFPFHSLRSIARQRKRDMIHNMKTVVEGVCCIQPSRAATRNRSSGYQMSAKIQYWMMLIYLWSVNSRCNMVPTYC